jgi:hypothetical protein
MDACRVFKEHVKILILEDRLYDTVITKWGRWDWGLTLPPHPEIETLKKEATENSRNHKCRPTDYHFTKQSDFN